MRKRDLRDLRRTKLRGRELSDWQSVGDETWTLVASGPQPQQDASTTPESLPHQAADPGGNGAGSGSFMRKRSAG